MNASNPFQIPTAYQIDLENRRRTRVKKTVIIAIGATTALLVGLLIEGCVSQHSKSAAAPAVKVAQEKSISNPQSVPAVALAKVVPPASAAPAPKAAETFYVVKSGDTLTKIAKTRGVTVKAIKSANDLSSDNVVVGAKLKIPSA